MVTLCYISGGSAWLSNLITHITVEPNDTDSIGIILITKRCKITKYFIVETARVFAMDCIPLARAISNVIKNAMSEFLP